MQVGMQNTRTVELALLTTFVALGGMVLSLLLHGISEAATICCRLMSGGPLDPPDKRFSV
jgi:hypothetical protein